MKKLLIALILPVMMLSNIMAQNCNVVVFSEDGEKFYLVVNGLRQNEEAATNIKVEDLQPTNYRLKIIFEDQNLGEIDKNIFLSEPSHEYTFNVKENKKGEQVLKAYSYVPLNQAPKSPNTQTVIVYNTNPQPATSTTVVTEEVTTTTSSTGSDMGTGTTTTTTSGGTGTGETFNMSVNVNGTGMDVNVTTNETGMDMNSSTTTTGTSTYTTTTTTTTTTSTTGGGYEEPYTEPAPTPMPGYNGPVGCAWPMSDEDFRGVKQSIESKSFEENRLQVAKQVINSNCLSSAQVKEIMLLFSFEDSRLEFAKYAYGYTHDLGNYYKVNDAFTFSSSIDELDEYISQQR